MGLKRQRKQVAKINKNQKKWRIGFWIKPKQKRKKRKHILVQFVEKMWAIAQGNVRGAINGYTIDAMYQIKG